MKFKKGDEVICISAPWDDFSEPCMVQFGPRVHETVKVEFNSVEHKGYIGISEYTEVGHDKYVILYHERHFEKILNEVELVSELERIVKLKR